MTSHHHQDDCLILTGVERRLLSTKAFRRRRDGTWNVQGYGDAKWFSAQPHGFGSLREMMEMLSRVSRNPLTLLVGEEINPLANAGKLVRRIHEKEGVVPGLVHHSRGHRWIMWDVDGASAKPDWFDPTSKDRSRDGDFVRWWIKQHLPPQFHDKSAILQWSSSALVDGKISLHIWQWLDRPVARESIYAYFDANAPKWKGIIDAGIWQNARIHYIADPVFYHVDGSKMDDPLAGVRWQWVQGSAGDVCEAPLEWVDRPTWAANKAKEEAAKEAEQRANIARQAAIVAAAAASRASRSKGRKGRGGFDAGRAGEEAAARNILASHKQAIEALSTADSKHEALLSIAMRAVISCGAVLSQGEIRAELEGAAAASLRCHGKRSRSPAAANEEAGAIFDSAFLKATPLPLKVSEFGGIGAGLCSPPAKTVATTATTTQTTPISLCGDSAVIEPVDSDLSFDLDVEAENFGIQFIDARADLAHLVADAVRDGGRHAISAPAGLGKSHAVCETLIAYRRERRLTPDSPVHIAAPDLGLARELRDELRGRGANAVLAVTRTEKNCEKFAEFVLAGKLTPGGGKTLCERCDLHPKRAGSVDACAFWRTFSAQAKADFICESHALEALKGELVTVGSERGEALPPPVRIDWASFGEVDPGDTAVPWVKRTAQEITVSARVCYRVGEGTPPPLPCYEDTPRWTSASKTGLIEWVAAALKCEPNRASVAEAATGGRAVKAFMDWTAIGQLAGSSALYRPYAYRETKGWLQGWHIGVERAEASTGGQPLPEIEFTGTHPLTPESKAEIRAWIRAAWGVETNLDLDEHARAHVDEWPIDALIIDESILHALRYGGSLTRAQLSDLRLAGEIAGVAVEALLKLMWRSEENKALKDKKKPHYFPSDAILREVGCDLDVISKHESGAARLREALHLEDGEQRLQHLAAGWGWEAVEALRSCVASSWLGAYIDSGVLYVAGPRKLACEGVRAVLLLDATMTETQAKAALGEGVKFEQIKVCQNPFLEVVHVPVDLGPRAGAWGTAEGPRTKRSAGHLGAALCRWGGPNTVAFLHKRALDPSLCWVADLVADGYFGAMTYHGASQSRGSNRWRAFETNIMTGHHVPRSARRQQAELLARMCGEPFGGDRAGDWLEEAAWLLEGGAQVQELARIRPLDATKDKPKRLIFLDKRRPEEFGLSTTTETDPDLLAWEEFAVLPPVCEDSEGGLRYEVMAAVVREAIALGGGVLPVGGEAIALPPPVRQVVENNHVKGFWSACQYIDTDAKAETLSQRISSWHRKQFGGDWHALSVTLEVEASPIRIPGRPPLVTLHTRPLPQVRPALEVHLARMGYTQYRLPDQPLATIGGFEPDDVLWAALAPLPKSSLACQNISTIYQLIAANAGVTPRTAQNWIAARRLPGEDNRTCIARAWACVRAYTETAVRAECERRAVEEAGMTKEDAVLAVAKWFTTEGCAPAQLADLAGSIIDDSADSLTEVDWQKTKALADVRGRS